MPDAPSGPQSKFGCTSGNKVSVLATNEGSAAGNVTVPLIVGDGEHRYRVDADWGALPADWFYIEATAVAVDSQDRVYVFNRGNHPLIVFDRGGQILHSWGEGLFQRPHGITIGPDDSLYLTDDFDHTVRKFSPDGELLLTLGTSGQASATGATSVDFRTIVQAGPPFHFPTNVALNRDGEIFVSDGYGNARVHHFDARGKLIHSWGRPGTGAGEFQIPHGIAIDSDGLVWVADRENSRLQAFTQAGEFVKEWRDIARPCHLHILPDGTKYVAEVGYRAGMWPGISPPSPNPCGGRISIYDSEQRLLSRWGGGDRPGEPGDFLAPHDIAVDSHGDIYVAEVTWSAGGKQGLVPANCRSLQKFVKI